MLSKPKGPSVTWTDAEILTLTKVFLKAMIVDSMEKKFFYKELSYLGEIFEGLLYNF